MHFGNAQRQAHSGVSLFTEAMGKREHLNVSAATCIVRSDLGQTVCPERVSF